MEITFRDRFTSRKVTGTFRRELDNGNLIVSVMQRSARGRLWIAQDRIVRPEQIVDPVVRDPESWQAVADAGRKYA
jgi:hypothetical protein